MNTIKILGNNVWVKLQEEPQHSTVKGVIVPLFERGETDGGRPIASLSSTSYLTKGTIVAIGTDVTTLSKGQTVYVKQEAYSPSFQFFHPRDTKVLEFTGDILIPASFVQAIVSDSSTELEN